jgi:putative transposase
VLVYKSFRYRAYPSAEQIERLGRWESALRFLWNLANEQRLIGLRRPRGWRRYYTACDQAKELTELRAALPWLSDVPRHVCGQVLADLDRAWQRCFKGLSQPPRWKQKGRDNLSFCESDPNGWRIEGGLLHFPKLGSMRVVQHRSLLGKAKTCRLVRDVDQWFVSVVCEIDIANPPISGKPAIGIDRGVTNLLADSNGRIVPNPKYVERAQQSLKRAQRALSRKKKGSKNQERAAVRVAKLHRKAHRRRDHVLQCESNRYAESQGVIVIEALRIKDMIRAGGALGRQIAGAGWRKFASMLEYKARDTGAMVIEVNPAYTSQTCSRCGVVDANNRKGERYACSSCGYVDHADVNAARNLLSRRSDGTQAAEDPLNQGVL